MRLAAAPSFSEFEPMTRTRQDEATECSEVLGLLFSLLSNSMIKLWLLIAYRAPARKLHII